MTTGQPAFDFGENWDNFSRHALDRKRVAASREDFRGLVSGIELRGRTFLDIGFGQGLGLLNASELGAQVAGGDLNPRCAQVLERNRQLYPSVVQPIPIVIGSILEPAVVGQLLALNEGRPYDVVHSWGVLHHTGDMETAITHAASLVAPGGAFILAIYNRHWSSRAWWAIKRTYVSSPRWVQRGFIAALLPVIYLAKWVVTGKNPRRQERGMDFHYDVIDWVGGYPYEFASVDETVASVTALGFALQRCIPATVPTGCNQFIFRRVSP